MRRLFPVIFAICILLCACGSSEPAPTAAPETTVPPVVATEPTTEATEPSTEPPTEPTEPPVLYRNPLSGEPLEEPWTGRTVAVVINNIEAALPQYGISRAEVIYELETEGGITRLLAVYSDVLSAGQIGPVRSARTFFNSIATGYDAPLVHCGGSVRGLAGYHDLVGSRIPNWEHVDARFYEGSYFFRDYDRYNSGVNWEHCLFTDGEKLMSALAKRGYETTTETPADYGQIFEEGATPDGETANKVTARFKWNKTTTLTYNAETGLYEAAQYGDPHIDETTGETLAYKNVFVLYTDQTSSNDGYYYRSYYKLIGSGEGVYACNGKLIPIKWSRESLDAPFVYTTAEGDPLVMDVGTSYVGIVDDGKPALYE